MEKKYQVYQIANKEVVVPGDYGSDCKDFTEVVSVLDQCQGVKFDSLEEAEIWLDTCLFKGDFVILPVYKIKH